MEPMREQHLGGLDSLHAVTALLQRIRNAHPTAGLYQAAELLWWWRDPRSTDELPQLFWFDGQGRSAAAVIAADFGDGSSALDSDEATRGGTWCQGELSITRHGPCPALAGRSFYWACSRTRLPSASKALMLVG